MKNIKVHNLSKLPIKEFSEFKELQEDFKEDCPIENKKLQDRIIEVGFKYPVFCWQDNKKESWVVDSHQRLKALRSLKNEGYEIPKIPYVRISAKNKKEAKKEILYLNSRYAFINPDSKFIIENFDINLDFNIGIPEIDIEGNIKIIKKEEIHLQPFLNNHILISYPIEKTTEIMEILEKLYNITNIEIEQGSN